MEAFTGHPIGRIPLKARPFLEIGHEACILPGQHARFAHQWRYFAWIKELAAQLYEFSLQFFRECTTLIGVTIGLSMGHKGGKWIRIAIWWKGMYAYTAKSQLIFTFYDPRFKTGLHPLQIGCQSQRFV